MVRLCVILDSGTSEACDEFVDVSYALNWAKRMTMPKRWYERLVSNEEIQLLPSEVIFF